MLRGEEQAGADPYVIAALRLLLFTGARMSEILTLQWEHVDFDRRCLALPTSKTGQKDVILNPGSLEVLGKLARVAGNPFVIVGKVEGKHLVNLEKPWRRIRQLAGIRDVRIYDLRHSHASIAAGLGASLPIIGALLGHTQAQTTARYAHLSADPVRAVSAAVSSRLTAALGGDGGADQPKVATLQPKRMAGGANTNRTARAPNNSRRWKSREGTIT